MDGWGGGRQFEMAVWDPPPPLPCGHMSQRGVNMTLALRYESKIMDSLLVFLILKLATVH